MSEQQLNELTMRHEQDKVKVNSFVQVAKNPSGKRPVNFNNGTTDIMSNTYVQQKQKTPVDLSKTNIYTDPMNQPLASNRSEHGIPMDDDLEKMMQRHNAEKQKVNGFNGSGQQSSRSQAGEAPQAFQQDLDREINREYENSDNGMDNTNQQLDEHLIST